MVERMIHGSDDVDGGAEAEVQLEAEDGRHALLVDVEVGDLGSRRLVGAVGRDADHLIARHEVSLAVDRALDLDVDEPEAVQPLGILARRWARDVLVVVRRIVVDGRGVSEKGAARD